MDMWKLQLLVLFLHCGASFCDTTTSKNLPYHVVLKDNIYEFFYDFDKDTITFEVHVKTLGYVGFGLSPHGGMKGGDIVIGWVIDGQVFFHDRHSEGNAMPEVDDHQDWELLSGSENDTHTILRFKRSLKNCDPQDLDVSDQTVRVIWAYNPEDPINEDKVQYHGSDKKGSHSIQLLNLNIKHPVLPPDAFSIDLRMNNLSLPDYYTVVWDQIIEIPDLDKDHHVIMHEPLTEPENVDIVHHLVVDSCPDSRHAAEAGAGKLGGAENNPATQERVKMPYSDCRKTFIVWLQGAGQFYYPENAGVLVGPSNPVKYMKLELHYNNPTRRVVQDSSGVRLWLTPTLRKYHADLLHVALPITPNQVIPYHAESFKTSAYCTPECIHDLLKEQSINVFAVLGHAHEASTEIKVRHIRDKKELPLLFNDQSYDTNLQEFRFLEEERVVKPGDSFKVECRYSTMDRDRVTYGGLGTPDEMCLSMLLYYPAIDVNYCGSSPEISQVVKALNATLGRGNKITRPEKYAGWKVKDVVEDQDWNDIGKQEYYEKHSESGRQRSMCFDRTNKAFKSSNRVFNADSFIEEPLPEVENCKKPALEKPSSSENNIRMDLIDAMNGALAVNIVNGEESSLQTSDESLNDKEQESMNIDILVHKFRNVEEKDELEIPKMIYAVKEEIVPPQEKEEIVPPQKFENVERMVHSGAPMWRISISLLALVVGFSIFC